MTMAEYGEGEPAVPVTRITQVVPSVEAQTDISAEEGALRTESLAVLEETPNVTKRAVKTGSVRVATRTEMHDEFAELMLSRSVVDVTRVKVDRIVDEAPQVRTEGDTTIVPVLEERLVVVKQLVLAEELHIRHRVEQAVERTPVTLRRQHATVERLDPDGRPIA